MSAKVPTLSAAGWVDHPAEKADQLISYYFVSEASQTHLYPGQVVSLTAQVQEWGHDPLELRQRIRDDMERYLRPYFDEVIIDVTTETPAVDGTNRFNVTLNCIVIDKGERYSLGRLITVVNSKIVRIVDINNNLST